MNMAIGEGIPEQKKLKKETGDIKNKMLCYRREDRAMPL